MRERLKKAGVVDSNGLKKLRGGEKILVAGLVTIRQRPASANGTIFLLLEDVRYLLRGFDRYRGVPDNLAFLLGRRQVDRVRRDGGADAASQQERCACKQASAAQRFHLDPRLPLNTLVVCAAI